MLTRCPVCATIFRVTPEQLKARTGRVRCGSCQHVFNALETLIEETAGAARTTQQSLSTPDLSETLVDISPLATPQEFAPPVADSSDSDKIEPSLSVEPTPHEPLLDTSPIWSDAIPPVRSPRRWPWLVGSFALLLALALQILYRYRVEFATLEPAMRPSLQALCRITGCEVGLPQKIAMINIESSDLRPHPNRTAQLALSATLRNRAPFPQAYPHLELTLTDSADRALARKVLSPTDYLPADRPEPQSAHSGLPANTDYAVNLGINHGELPASGYRLYAFYP